jgi:glyoxylase-like metal-dependent hydrolase (beta-lactamase superfamily II)
MLLLLCPLITSATGSNTQLKIIQLADNVYQHISYKKVQPWGMVAASGLIVVDESDAYIIDTPWSIKDTEKLLSWIKSKDLLIKSSIVTHFHDDASGGIPLLNQYRIKTYATPLTNNLLSLQNREKSSHEISSKTFSFANNLIEVFYPGAGHTQDNIVVWLPNEKILFGGCFVKNMQSKNLGYTGDASIKEWPISIQNVVNKYPNIKLVVPGHGKTGDISLLKHTAKLAQLKTVQ